MAQSTCTEHFHRRGSSMQPSTAASARQKPDSSRMHWNVVVEHNHQQFGAQISHRGPPCKQQKTPRLCQPMNPWRITRVPLPVLRTSLVGAALRHSWCACRLAIMRQRCQVTTALDPTPGCGARLHPASAQVALTGSCTSEQLFGVACQGHRCASSWMSVMGTGVCVHHLG